MKIAITGATGFIGKILVQKHLSLGDEIRILSRKDNCDFKDVEIIKGDLSNKEALSKLVTNVDILYHCAAEIKDESKMQEVHIEGTKNLIEASSSKVKHWVQLSSTGVYGPVNTGVIKEQQSYNPINEYEKTKLMSDILVLDAGKQKKFTYTIVRPSNVFGYQMTNQSIFQLVKMIERGFYFFVGPKGASANYVPVENVVEALYLAGTHPKAKNEIFIISNWCTIEDFVKNINLALKKPFPKLRVPITLIKVIAKLTSFVPGNPLTVARVRALSNKVIYETSKIEKELGYQQIVTIEETINKLVKFYKRKI